MKNRFLIYPLVVMGFILIITNSCKKDDPIIKKEVVITWANPADITVGTLLSATQLNATADVAGTFVYTPAIGTALSVGNNNLKVDFSPTDATNFNTATKTVKINVTAIPVTDINGNVYHIVRIGTQDWMVENLKTNKYRDGTTIPNITDNTEWYQQTAGAYCWNNNDSATYNSTYGALYNWYTVVDSRNLCPTGWHVPTDAEWLTLANFLEGQSVAGGKLKETGTTHWLSPNTDATNLTGFTALPGGFRDTYGTFVNIGSSGFWWSTTENDANTVWYPYIFYNYSILYRTFSDKKLGLSVRCVRD
jgi:uncharacterized protein (TIGR02145 family)